MGVLRPVEKTPEELLEDAESIGGLEPVGEPEQIEAVEGLDVHLPGAGAQAPRRPGRPRPGDRQGSPARSSSSTATSAGSRSSAARVSTTVALPLALIPGGPYFTDDQEDALARLGRSLLAGDHRYPALESILDRVPFQRAIQTTDLDEMKELVASLDGRHLVIQGPPGSGKTWTSGRLIADLISRRQARRRRLDEPQGDPQAPRARSRPRAELGLDFVGLKKASGGNPESEFDERPLHERHRARTTAPGVDVTGGTAWLFAREDHDSTLDYLFIDEAGQVSLADALAMGTCARNVVLVGDPQQLAQVIQGTHPDGTDASVLT